MLVRKQKVAGTLFFLFFFLVCFLSFSETDASIRQMWDSVKKLQQRVEKQKCALEVRYDALLECQRIAP